MATQSNAIKFGFGNTGLLPQEEMLEISTKHQKLIIGIPKEDSEVENRVALTPEAVEILINNGHEVVIESNAGNAANYTDKDYSDKGGIILKEKKLIYQSDILLKVAPPTIDEIELVKEQQVIISSLVISSITKEYIQKLMAKKVTAIAYENIKDEFECYPIVRSMNSISGAQAVLIAAGFLSNAHKGKGVLLGGVVGITPAEVVILGSGPAAEFAIRAAKGLGAVVKVFDNSLHNLVELQNMFANQLQTSVFHPQVITKALKSADVVIATCHLFQEGSKYLITEDMVKGMKKGSVIVDIGIAYGNCIETSEARTQKNAYYTKHGVIHYCIPNLPSLVARTSSIALSNIFLPLLLQMGNKGGIVKKLKDDRGLRNGVYIFNGILVNKHISSFFDISASDIDLLMAAF